MKVLSHLVSADVRRLRLPLVAWLVVVAANTVAEGTAGVGGANAQVREWMAIAASLVWLAEVLLLFVLVSLIIHAHPTVGTDAFWLTRPIPRRALLASKLLLIVTALVIAPAVADTIILAVHGVTPTIAAGVVAERASVQIFLVALLTLAAALTPNLVRLALLCGAAIVSVAVVLGVLVALEPESGFGDFPSPGVEWEDPATKQFVSAIVLVFAILVVLAVQYTRRNRWHTVATGIAGAVLSSVIGAWWPVPFLTPVLEVPDWARAETVRVSVDPATVSTSPAALFSPERGRLHSVGGLIRLEGMPRGWSFGAHARDGSLQLPDGTTLHTARGPVAMLFAGSGPTFQDRDLARDLLDVREVGQFTQPEDQASPRHTALLALEQADVARLAPAQGEFRGNVVISLAQHVVIGSVPLRTGAKYQDGSYGLTLGRTWYPNGNFSIEASEWRATSTFERRLPPRYSFYLRNATTSQAMALSDYDRRGMFTFFRLLPLSGFHMDPGQVGFHVRAVILTLPPRYADGTDTTNVDDEWARHAELVIVRTTQAGSIVRPLAVPDFPLNTPQQPRVTQR